MIQYIYYLIPGLTVVYTKNSSQNDEEHEALLARSRRVANASLILAERSAEEEDKMLHFQKRDFPLPEEIEWSPLPEEFQYWEKTLGLSHVQDQMGCGSCWSFPAVSFVGGFTFGLSFLFASSLYFSQGHITVRLISIQLQGNHFAM